MSEATKEPGAPPPESPAALIRWASIFLLALSAVMAPLISSEHLFLRLLCLMLGVAAAFFWLLQAIFERRVEAPWGWHAAGGALVLAAGTASAIASDCPQEAILTLFTWLAYAAAFVLAVWAGRNERVRRGLLCVVCAAAVPVSVLAVMQYAYLLDKTNAEIKSGKLDKFINARFSPEERDGLLRRTENKRVFSTFALPNSLAGYLLILLPPAIALLVLAKRGAAKWVLVGAVLLALLALFFTFSKGGWLAGLILLALFLISQGRRWLGRRWMVAAGVAAAAAVVLAGGIALSPTLRTRMQKMSNELSGSARVRTEYWAAGLSMWQSSPILGVGPGNFKNHYMIHKSVAAEETKHAHNDYVQVLAECGPLALAGYVLFWLAVVCGSSRRREAPALPPESPPLRYVLGAAGTLGVLIAGYAGQLLNVFDEPFLDGIFICALAALWWVVYRACSRSASRAAPGPLAFGLLLGLLGFALHTLVDLDLYVEGVGYTAFIVAGLAAAPWARVKVFRLEGAPQLIVTIVVSVAGVGMFLGARRVGTADVLRASGLTLARQEAKQRLSPDALRSLKAACRSNPLDHGAFAALGASLERSPVAADLEAAMTAWRRAVRLDPSYADYHARLGRLFRRVARRRPALLKPHAEDYEQLAKTLTGVPAGAAAKSYLPAIVETARAVENAPTKPQYRILHGETLLEARLAAEAEEQFRMALSLNDAMIRGGAPRRQWLSKAQVLSLLDRLGLTGVEGAAIIRE